MEIVLIRHGQVFTDSKVLVDRKLNPDLSPTGRNACQELKDELKNMHFDRIYSSPLKRAKQTAEILFTNEPDMVEMDGLSEVDLGWLSGKRYNLFTFLMVFVNYFWTKPFGGDNRFNFYAKVKSTFSQILNDSKKAGLERIAIVTHNGVILTILWHHLRLMGFRFSVKYVQPYTISVQSTEMNTLKYQLVKSHAR